MEKILELVREINRLSETHSPTIRHLSDQIIHLCGDEELYTKKEVIEMLSKDKYKLDKEDER